MRKHQRLNSYHQELANRAASRHATPAERKPVPAHVQEVTDAQRLYAAAKSAAMRGECAAPRMSDYVGIVDGTMVVTEFAKKLLAEMAVAA